MKYPEATILIVEDNRDDALLIQRALRRANLINPFANVVTEPLTARGGFALAHWQKKMKQSKNVRNEAVLCLTKTSFGQTRFSVVLER